MELIKRVYKSASNWLERVSQEAEWDKSIRDLMKPTHNMREVIPGWDDDYPEPMFDDDWRPTSEVYTNESVDLFSDKALDALEELVDYLQEPVNDSYQFTGFTEVEQSYLDLTEDCTSCKYFHGVQYNDVDLICSIHPFGNINCADFESKYGIEPDDCLEVEDDYDLTEEDELRYQYKHYYEFVKDAEWVSDDLEHYLGKYEQ